MLDTGVHERLALHHVAAGGVEGLGTSLGVEQHLCGTGRSGLVLRSGEQSASHAQLAQPPLDDHPLELPGSLADISQPAGCDDPGLIQPDDLHGLVVEVVPLLFLIDPLLTAEDLDPQGQRSLDLRGVAGGANGDGQTAAGVDGSAVTWRWTSPLP